MYLMEHLRIIKFIELVMDSFENSVEVYTKGSCVQFCLMLKYVFPEGEIYWNEDHAIFKYHEHFYDITGEVDGSKYDMKLMDYGILKVNSLLKLQYKKPAEKPTGLKNT